MILADNGIDATFNVSEVQSWMRCPFRWWACWVMNKVPIHEAQPLSFGKLIHRIFEDYYTGYGTDHFGGPATMVGAIERQRYLWVLKMAETTDPVDLVVGEKVLKQLDDLTEALVQWKDTLTPDVEEDGDQHIHCLEVETPFEFNLGNGLRARGRPDRMAVEYGTLWHKQHKALAAGTHFGVFTDLAKRSYHEHLYAEAEHEKYPQYKVGGTQFNLIRKLKYRTKVTKNNPLGEVKQLNEMFCQLPMSIDLESPLHEHVMDSIRYHANNMRRTQLLWLNEGRIPAPNETMNGGQFGNSPDDYYRVLTGEIELDDPRYFGPREDTYAPPEGDAE